MLARSALVPERIGHVAPASRRGLLRSAQDIRRPCFARTRALLGGLPSLLNGSVAHAAENLFGARPVILHRGRPLAGEGWIPVPLPPPTGPAQLSLPAREGLGSPGTPRVFARTSGLALTPTAAKRSLFSL